MKIPQSVRDEIAKGPLAHLTTLNKDGSPQITVVWVGIEGEEFVIGYPGASSEDQEHPARRTRSAVLHRPEHQQGRNARKTTYANFRKSRAHANFDRFSETSKIDPCTRAGSIYGWRRGVNSNCRYRSLNSQTTTSCYNLRR